MTEPPDRPPHRPKAPGPQTRDALDAQIGRALHRPPPVPAPGAGEPDDDALLRVLDGQADAVERSRALGFTLAAEKLAIVGDLAAAAPPPPARYLFAVAPGCIDLLRGSSDLRDRFGSIETELRVAEVTPPHGTPTVDVEVAVNRASAPVSAAAVALRRDGRTLATATTDSSGKVLFGNLLPARYEIELAEGTLVVDVRGL